MDFVLECLTDYISIVIVQDSSRSQSKSKVLKNIHSCGVNVIN